MVLGISKTHWHHWDIQLLRSSWIKAKPAAGDTFSWVICWKQQMVDLLIQVCQLRLRVQLVTIAPGSLHWWYNDGKLPKKKPDHVEYSLLTERWRQKGKAHQSYGSFWPFSAQHAPSPPPVVLLFCLLQMHGSCRAWELHEINKSLSLLECLTPCTVCSLF